MVELAAMLQPKAKILPKAQCRLFSDACIVEPIQMIIQRIIESGHLLACLGFVYPYFTLHIQCCLLKRMKPPLCVWVGDLLTSLHVKHQVPGATKNSG